MKHGLPDDVVGRIREVLARHPDLEEAVLYGSRAKGTHHPGSDIDLTLKGPDLDHGELTEIDNELDDLMLPYRFDLSLFAELSHPGLLDHIQRVGVVLHAREAARKDAGSR